MLSKLLYRVSGRLPRRQIHVNNALYLERYYVGSLFGVTFYLHRFMSSDGESHLHNHPWTWGRALVLSGWYDEERAVNLYTRGLFVKYQTIRWWSAVNANTIHRIAHVAPDTWTLFMHGPRHGHGWGFLEQKGNTTYFEPSGKPVKPPRVERAAPI